MPFLPRWGWELILSTAYPSKPDPFKQVQVDASYENRVMIAATYDICYCDENCLNSVYCFKATVVFMCVGMRMREGERERERDIERDDDGTNRLREMRKLNPTHPFLPKRVNYPTYRFYFNSI